MMVSNLFADPAPVSEARALADARRRYPDLGWWGDQGALACAALRDRAAGVVSLATRLSDQDAAWQNEYRTRRFPAEERTADVPVGGASAPVMGVAHLRDGREVVNEDHLLKWNRPNV